MNNNNSISLFLFIYLTAGICHNEITWTVNFAYQKSHASAAMKQGMKTMQLENGLCLAAGTTLKYMYVANRYSHILDRSLLITPYSTH